MKKIIKAYLSRQLRLGFDNLPVDHLPSKVTVSRNQSCIFRREPGIIVMYRVTVRLERHRTVIVPFEHQFPVFRVCLAQEPKLVNALVVAEPATSARCRRVDRGKQVVFLAKLAAMLFIPPGGDQRKHVSGLCVTQDSLRLVSSYAQVLDGICTCAPSTARFRKGLCVPAV